MVCGGPGVCRSEFSGVADAAGRSTVAVAALTSVASVGNRGCGYRFRSSRSQARKR
jgi:hypothetical protein